MGEHENETEQTEERAVERQQRLAFLLTHVRQYPDHVLRMQTRQVSEFDEALAGLVERMTRVMEGAHGVGLAAPQVGVLQRVFVYRPDDAEEPRALVNPRVVARGEEHEVAEEGCLSLGAASVVVDVERPLSITVEAQSPSGEALSFEAEGLTARIIQHELDHLDGVLIIDRTTPEQRKAALAELRPQPVLRSLA